jgi:hypothetical protein
MILIGMGVGFVLGLVPLIVGIVKGQKKLAAWGFLASVAAGAAWSLFSVVAVVIFVFLILKKNSVGNSLKAEISAETDKISE